jgi:hypothetical protein
MLPCGLRRVSFFTHLSTTRQMYEGRGTGLLLFNNVNSFSLSSVGIITGLMRGHAGYPFLLWDVLFFTWMYSTCHTGDQEMNRFFFASCIGLDRVTRKANPYGFLVGSFGTSGLD